MNLWAPVIQHFISGRPQRSQTPYPEPPTCLLRSTPAPKIRYSQVKSPQKSPHSQVCSLSVSRGSFCAQPACTRRCWPGEPGLATRCEILCSHSMSPSYSRKRYLVLAGNTNRSQLKSARLRGLACMLACQGSGYQIWIIFRSQLVAFCWTADCCRMRLTESSHAIDFLPYALPAARLRDSTDASLDSLCAIPNCQLGLNHDLAWFVSTSTHTSVDTSFGSLNNRMIPAVIVGSWHKGNNASSKRR